jgi:serpin B
MKLRLACAAAALFCSQAGPLAAQPASGNQFAWESLLRLCSLKQQSVVYSPYSVQEAVGMLQSGARGDTATQVRNSLGLPSTTERARQNAALRKLEPAVTFRSQNALFVASDLPLKPAYAAAVAQQFEARASNVDFASPKTLPAINAWAEQKTGGKIKNLLNPQQVDARTRAVLLNAVYLKATWLHEFDKKRTRPGAFWDGRTQRNVAMMHQNGMFLYAAAPDFSVLEVPYAGERLVFDCILPNEQDGLTELRGNLQWPDLNTVLHQLAPTDVELTLPRLKTESSHSLLPVLTMMGLPAAGDYSGISPERLVISEVAQKAFLELDEQGTEAAAATAVVMTRSLPQRVEFHVNRPFLYLIRDTGTETILFAGQVYTPE